MHSTHVPDDAFYYFEIAKNWLTYGFPTMDLRNGTTGFHLLSAAHYMALGSLTGWDPWLTIFLVQLWSVIVIALGVLLIPFSTASAGGHLIAVAAVIFSPVLLNLGVYSMDTWGSVLAGALLARAIFSGKSSLLFFAGVLGVLSREENILIFAGVIFWFLFRRKTLQAALIGMTLASTFVLSRLIRQAVNVGELIDSVSVKLYLSQLVGHSPDNILLLMCETTSPCGVSVSIMGVWSTVAIFSGLLVLVMVLIAKPGPVSAKAPHSPNQNKTSLIAMALYQLLVVTGIHTFNSNFSPVWYVGSFAVPLIVLIAFVLDRVYSKLARGALLAGISSGAVIALVLSLQTAPWPHHKEVHRVAVSLQSGPEGIFGAWNSGLLTVASGRNITNLDGLVNQKAASFIVNDDFIGYLKIEPLDFIIDWGAMVGTYQANWGDSQGIASRCLVRETIFLGDQTWLESRMTVWEIDQNCVSGG